MIGESLGVSREKTALEAETVEGIQASVCASISMSHTKTAQ